jgi:hypothetical protein
VTLDTFAEYVRTWVSQYIAGFCLVTIAMWAGAVYLWGKKWQRQVRDSGVYLLAIGTLTLALALRPEGGQLFFWKPVTWFCFTMLMILELLWMLFLVEALGRALHDWTTRLAKRDAPEEPNPSARPETSALK